MADVIAIHPDCTGFHIIETHQQVDHRTLAASGRTYDSDPLSRFYRQVEVLDQGFLRYIGEVHMIQFHTSFCLF